VTSAITDQETLNVSPEHSRVFACRIQSLRLTWPNPIKWNRKGPLFQKWFDLRRSPKRLFSTAVAPGTSPR
jgi:hypothetical protein